ncbi:hypothetical protein BGW37DRAFT_272453 [Umbelopsis sp. PMI_123]|nr:hypothetical protein BGW37DRAFT_272453 [Umbelopsis sp. PMI_123]
MDKKLSQAKQNCHSVSGDRVCFSAVFTSVVFLSHSITTSALALPRPVLRCYRPLIIHSLYSTRRTPPCLPLLGRYVALFFCCAFPVISSPQFNCLFVCIVNINHSCKY